MRVSAKPCLQRKSPPPPPPGPSEQRLAQIDALKRRSSLVNVLDPLAITLGLAFTPQATLGSIGQVGGALLNGQIEVAQGSLEALVQRAVNPAAPFNSMYRGGQWTGAGVDGTVGALEIRHGLSSGNQAMLGMGVADLVGGTSSAFIAAGHPAVSLGLSVASAALKTALVVAQPRRFTSVQRAKTLFDAGLAVSSSMLRAGVGVIPALVIQGALSGGQLLYMNHEPTRLRTDAAIPWLSQPSDL